MLSFIAYILIYLFISYRLTNYNVYIKMNAGLWNTNKNNDVAQSCKEN